MTYHKSQKKIFSGSSPLPPFYYSRGKTVLTSFLIGLLLFMGSFVFSQESEFSTSTATSTKGEEAPLYGKIYEDIGEIIGEYSSSTGFYDDRTREDLESYVQGKIQKAFLEGGLLLGGGGDCTLFEDDFNDYSEGDLNGQGGWSGSGDFDVQGTVIFEGAKAVYVNSSGAFAQIVKAGDLDVEDGRIVWYWRLENGNSNDVYITDSSNITIIQINANGSNIRYRDGAGSYHNLCSYSNGDNEWYYLQLEWRSSDSTARASCNNAPFTDWLSRRSSNIPRKFLMEAEPSGAIFYLDYISEFEYEMATSTFLIENASTGASFYLERTVSYGDALVIFLLTIMCVAILFRSIFDLEIPKRMNFKRH